MRRTSTIALIALAIVIVGSVFSAPSGLYGPASADDSDGIVTVIAVDEGLAPSPGDIEAAETGLLTLTRTIDHGTVAFMPYGLEAREPVEYPAGAAAVDAARDAVAALEGTVGPNRSDQFALLTKTFTYFANNDAPRGSRITMITPGRILGESENTRARLKSVGDLYAAEGWAIDVLTMPSTPIVLRELLGELTTSSGGVFYDLGSAEGLAQFMSARTGIQLTAGINVELTGNTVTSTFEVAPLTQSLSAAFLRARGDTEVALFRPNGAPATAELANVEITEAPNIVIMHVERPVAGTWSLQGVGDSAKLIAGVEQRSPLVLQLIEQPPIPVGEPGLLEATTLVDGVPQPIAGARVEAQVTRPNGSTEVYVLNDTGTGGDRRAADGIFTALLPEPEAQGINDVSLKLSWTDFKAELASKGAYQTEIFPTIKVTQVSDIEAFLGDSAVVASVQVFVGEFPRLVSPDEITVTLMGPTGEIAGTVVPRSEPEPGKGWEFDIVAEPPVTGDYAISVILAGDHLGRPYSAAAPELTAAALISERPLRIFGLPPWTWIAILAVVIVGLVLVILSSRRTRPYGYLYDDQDRVVVDFGRLHRNPLRRLLATDHVSAAEVPGLPFRGGSFRFVGGRVELRYQRVPGDPSLRVNSRPAGPKITLGDDVWLGVGGRLMTFVTEKRPTAMFVPAHADD